MLIREIFEATDDDRKWDHVHQKHLDKTGFWGAAGAGCIFLAKDTGRILLALRSQAVKQPGTYGNWGGAIDPGDNPIEAAKREAQEETGGRARISEIVPLYVFKKDTFRYFNFLAVVDQEFDPVLNWETDGYEWCDWGDWPHPLHFGLVSLFNDPKSVETIKRYLYLD